MGRGAYGASRAARQARLAKQARGLGRSELTEAIIREDERAMAWSRTLPPFRQRTPQMRRMIVQRDIIFEDNVNALENEDFRREQEAMDRARRRRGRRSS